MYVNPKKGCSSAAAAFGVNVHVILGSVDRLGEKL